MTYNRECKQCGQAFVANRTTALYCCKSCKWRAKQDKDVDRRQFPKTCLQCGSDFIARESNIRFCSMDCANIARTNFRQCVVCAAEVKPSLMIKGVYCSAACRTQHLSRVCKCGQPFKVHGERDDLCVKCHSVERKRNAVQQRKAERLAKPRNCKTCGNVFHSAGKRVYCDPCKPKPDNRRHKLKEQRELLLQFLIERDGSDCYLCKRPIDLTITDLNTDDDAVTIDHVMPLSKGGANSPSNVKLAHRGCNVSKGSTVLPL